MKKKQQNYGILDYRYSQEQEELVEEMLRELYQENEKLFVVIDDDPTGGQTVHDVAVYTGWKKDVILKAFEAEKKMFYVMTNSRSMTESETSRIHKEIMDSLNYASKVTGRDYEVISRGDSTLRGHYPLEPELIRRGAEKPVIKELIIPFFQEGNRYTIEDIHCLWEEGNLIPVGESEFARDKTFGFHNSNLKLWVEEKTKGAYSADWVASVELQSLRGLDFDGVEAVLMEEKNEKIIVNATCYMDLKVFAICYYRALAKGICFVARTASSWPKTVGCFADIPYIQGKDLVNGNSLEGGLVIIGSHVRKTTEQFEVLKASGLNLDYIEFNQHEAVDEKRLDAEVRRVSELANRKLGERRTVVIYTRRERIDFNTGSGEEELLITNRIADAVTAIAGSIEKKPRFVVVKGGITSSDIAVKAFHAKKAYIWGQAAPGIPVWRLGKESKYPGMTYVIFPGNVGTKYTLYEIVNSLR